MQYFVSLEIPEEIGTRFISDPAGSLLSVLNTGKPQLTLMLQSYYTHEKVSGVEPNHSSLTLSDTNAGQITVQYILEEFSVCSNTDRVERESMQLQLTVNSEFRLLKIAGIYIPEREPDSF